MFFIVLKFIVVFGTNIPIFLAGCITIAKSVEKWEIVGTLPELCLA
jgi:hypothetical protein